MELLIWILIMIPVVGWVFTGFSFSLLFSELPKLFFWYLVVFIIDKFAETHVFSSIFN